MGGSNSSAAFAEETVWPHVTIFHRHHADSTPTRALLLRCVCLGRRIKFLYLGGGGRRCRCRGH
eukprot:12359437-Alexandrium_andersonii.AAC.1